MKPGRALVYILKQSVGQPVEQKLLTAEQLKELHEKLQLEEHTVGWGLELKTKLYELLEGWPICLKLTGDFPHGRGCLP